ncbi:MAG TPA: PPOX class F420-dependent oxidoreductase [Actinomycetes bacterium]|nr:PPOX class F420-dependent oxidoreductase [Actinomycetes bacterium]
MVTADEAREFVASNHRAVLITRGSAGGIQASPVFAGVDGDGKLVISTRETAYKTRNLRRDPSAVLCVITETFLGRWLRIDGTAEVLALPEAMEPLVDYYRRVAGEHPDWDEYRQAMRDQRRVLVRITIDRAGPTRGG